MEYPLTLMNLLMQVKMLVVLILVLMEYPLTRYDNLSEAEFTS